MAITVRRAIAVAIYVQNGSGSAGAPFSLSGLFFGIFGILAGGGSE